jgi:hypothetical protein
LHFAEALFACGAILMINAFVPNLTQHAPRSPRVRLGGYAHLARLLDKARAVLAGTGGDYHYNCSLDRRFFDFTGIDHAAMLDAIKTGLTDSQMLAWVNEKSGKSPVEVVAWSAWLEQNGPGSADMHTWIAGRITETAPGREDIRTFFDLLDLDDYVSFGGKA